jgi:hypothetical protein
MDDWYRTWKRWNEAPFGDIGDQAVYYRSELQKAGVRSLRDLRVLELGFGNGGFARWSREQGAAWTGVEIDGTLVERARQAGFEAVQDSGIPETLECHTPFDLAVAWDVLEHVPRTLLPQYLHAVRSRLSPRGFLLARMPSGDSPFARAIQYGDLTHQPPLGSSAIRVLAIRAGFGSVSVRATALPVFGLGIRSGIRRSWVRGVDLVARPILAALMRDSSAVITPNMTVEMRP